MSSTYHSAEPMKRNFWYLTKTPLFCRSKKPDEVWRFLPMMNRNIDTSMPVFLNKESVTEYRVADARDLLF